MSSAATATVRKPVRSEGAVELCYCKHTQEQHDAGGCTAGACHCRSYLPRPCACGHAAHGHKCSERGCACKYYRRDDTPELLLRQGIRSGEWFQGIKARIRGLMRPGVDFDARVYACLMMHTDHRPGDKHARLAVKIGKDNRSTPITSTDIARELNEQDALGAATPRNVRRTLRTLEEDGFVRQVGLTKGNVRIFVYARPLEYRTIDPDDEIPDDDTPDDPADPNIGIRSDTNLPVTHTNNNQLPETMFSHIKGTVVKSFLKTLREYLPEPEIGITFDTQKAADEALEEILKVLKSEIQKIVLGIKSDPAYKEVRLSRSTSSSSPSEPAPEEVKPTTTTPDSSQPEFHALLCARFREAGKPVPTRKQSIAVQKTLNDSAGDFVAWLNPQKLRPIRHPGALPQLAEEFLAWLASRPAPVQKPEPNPEQLRAALLWIVHEDPDATPEQRADAQRRLNQLPQFAAEAMTV